MSPVPRGKKDEGETVEFIPNMEKRELPELSSGND
jgi:hypothetical protein